MQKLVLVIAVFGLAGCRSGVVYTDRPAPRYAAQRAPAAQRAQDTLRIVTYNIKYARNIDSALVVLTTDTGVTGADVLLLQEMDAPGSERIAELLGMSYVYYPATSYERGDFGNAVLSRLPILEDVRIPLPHLSRLGGTARTATAVTLRWGADSLRIYSVHLATWAGLGPNDRRDQMRAVLADAQRFSKVIIGGDLNSRTVGRVVEEAGYLWPTEHGPRTVALGRWDHIMVRGLTPGETGTVLDRRRASDHRAVWLTVTVP